MQPVKICSWSEVADREPCGVLVEGVDLVIVRFGDLTTFRRETADLAGIDFGGVR